MNIAIEHVEAVNALTILEKVKESYITVTPDDRDSEVTVIINDVTSIKSTYDNDEEGLQVVTKWGRILNISYLSYGHITIM